MAIDKNKGEVVWDSFLQRWPLEKLVTMTLEEYTQAGNQDCFSFGWLEQSTECLGSVWGGSSFKFGVYSREDKSSKVDGAGRSYSTDYGWYSKYGDTSEEAFERVKSIIVAVAKAAQEGNFDVIEQSDLGPAIKWKVAFLYQNRSSPTIVPVYSAEHLAAYLGITSKASVSQLQTQVMAQRGDIDVLTYGRNVWQKADAILSAQVLNPEKALAFFQEHRDRFTPVKPPTKYIAGFTTLDGRTLALEKDPKRKEVKLWLEPGEWLDKIRAQVKNIVSYPPDRTRNSNLTSNAPGLDVGHHAVLLTVPTHAVLVALCDAYDRSDTSERISMPTKLQTTPVKVPLNQILFGPPGTGKTYATVDEALRILDPSYLEQYKTDRSALKSRFDEYVASENIRFVTFHQSFSYEDFVEGLRAASNDDKQLEYLVEPGVFKRLCDDARTRGIQPEAGIRSNPRIWKISINGTGPSPTKTYCIDHGEARIGWGATGNLADQQFEGNSYYETLGTGDQGTLRYFSQEIVPGDILLCIHSAEAIGAIGVVTGEYRYEETIPSEVRGGYNHVLPVKWLYRDLELPISPLNDGKQFTPKTVYSMERFSWGDLLSHIEKSGVKPVGQIGAKINSRPYVLIIDEINRGNISRIFGELITLIEPSKRAGAEEELSVTLPYSKKPFNVPKNVYLIGTMNTADRSLSGLDIALRRRFTFLEMPPKPEFIDDIEVEGINVGKLLRTINDRIEVLLDRDHCLGHAYFIPLRDDPSLSNLKFIFRQQVLPLMQEYFFEDWERIAWVLGDHKKPEDRAFIRQNGTDLDALFGQEVSEQLINSGKRWHINEQAFDSIDSYREILGASA